MRLASRRDVNERRVIDALKACGAYVKQINDAGAFDLLVYYRGYTLLLEVKDGDKSPSQRALTPAEAKFHAEWPGQNLYIVNSEHEALDILKKCV
jgi:hypothetical protein